MKVLRIIWLSFLLFQTSLSFGYQVDTNQQKDIRGTIAAPSSLLDGHKPIAQWIWNSGEKNPRNQYLLVRKTINLNQNIDSVTAYISAYAVADIYINGQLVDRCPINCDPEYQVYEKFDLTRFFHPGENIISAIVYNFGIGMHHRINARGGFFFQGKAVLADHSVMEMNSDGSWLVSTNHGWERDTELRTGSGEGAPNLIGFIEKFDAREVPEEWQLSGFDDSHWEKAYVIGTPPLKPWNQIVLVQRPTLFREMVYPVDRWEVNGWVVYDFGQEVTGVPVIGLSAGEDGTDITIGTAERLFPDRTADFKRRVRYEDHYITRKGDQQWSPFTWRGFRYLTFPVDLEIKILDIAAVNRHYAVQDEGSFECSDPLLNRIWNAGRFTLNLCSQDTYMDTPWREQTQYIAGDSRYLQKYAFYASGLSSEFLTRYNILSGAWSQRWATDGSIRSRYPTDWLIGEGTSGYLVDYELEWVIMLGEYYQYFGNKDLILQVYPNLIKLMGKFETLIGKEHGVLSGVPGWIVLDHPDTYPMDQQKEITALNCLYYGALRQASRLAKAVVSDPDQSKIWDSEAAELKQNIKKWFWSADRKLYADSYGSKHCSQQTQVYALLYGLVDEADKSWSVSYIKDQGRASEMSFAYYVVYSLFDQEDKYALEYIRKYWGDQMKLASFNGGWQEGWNVEEWTGDIGSTSHAWCSGPTALLPQKVLGVEPVITVSTTAWSEFRIAPHTGDLKWAKGVVSSPAGIIHVSWTRTGQLFELNAEVPEGTRALISVPGENIMVNGKPVNEIAGIEIVNKELKHLEFIVLAGKYQISSQEMK
ncbi:MAG: family 78 glycoside hydrolase catalytic domain [Bacteroidales bacterium]